MCFDLEKSGLWDFEMFITDSSGKEESLNFQINLLDRNGKQALFNFILFI